MDISLESRFAAIVHVLLRSDLVGYEELDEIEKEAASILSNIAKVESNERDDAINKLVEFLKRPKPEKKVEIEITERK